MSLREANEVNGELSKEEALEAVYAGRIRRENGFAQIPSVILVEKIDVSMSPLPAMELFAQPAEVGIFKGKNQPFSPLALSLRPFVWIRDEDLASIRRVVESQILDPTGGRGSSGDASAMPAAQRMEILRRSAIAVVDDLYRDPSPENIRKGTKIVSSFVYVLMREPKAYLHLAKLSSHDPYTLQHSVGTAVNSVILARKIGITDPAELQEAGLGGLLHDIGKVRVKREIINKQGPLDELEWEEMRGHSLAGYEIVADNPDLTERTKRAILEHHEEKAGTGYPHGRRHDQIEVHAKIVCICDIFNALTTNRSYSKARTPYDAFELMRDKLGHKIDDELFKALVLVYGGKLPSSAPAPAPEGGLAAA